MCTSVWITFFFYSPKITIFASFFFYEKKNSFNFTRAKYVTLREVTIQY